MASIFDAAQSGDVAALRNQLDGSASSGPVDINGKDANGRSALILAVEAGHEDAVSELLSRGADRHEALAAGHGQNGSSIASLLNEAQLRSQHPGSDDQQPAPHHMYAPIPTDIYGGYQLPDGSIAYGGYPQYPPPFQGQGASGAPGQPAFYHDPVMFPHAYPSFPPMNGGPRPRGSSSFGQGRKPSTVGKLPPPEVAKTIPCRFYPNCRNGASCIFAHIDGPVPENGDVASPSHPHHGPPHHPHHHIPQDGSAGHPPPPPGYYGMPQSFPPHFFMMPPGANGAGPMGMPFGGPSGAPMPLHYQPHEAPHPGQMTPVAPMAEVQAQEGAASAPEQSTAGEAAASPALANGEEAPKAATAEDEEKTTTEQDAATTADSAAQPRRQSFSTFLHSHAVPFQPASVVSSVNGAAVPIPIGPAAGYHGQGHNQGGFSGRGKLRGRGGGAAGMMGRGKHERSPCTFFARNACKYGSECLFPHILLDGSDARRLPGMLAQSQHQRHHQLHAHHHNQQVEGAAAGPSSAGLVNGEPTKTGNTPRQPAAASVPLGPKLKREAGLPPTPSAEVTSTAAAQQHESGSSKKEKAQPNGSAVVPSKPSATATAAAAASASSSPTQQQAQPAQSAAPPQTATSSQQQPQQPRKGNSKANGNAQNGKKGNAAASSAASAAAPQQRMPIGADFPALPGSPNTNGTPSSAPSQPAPTTKGTAATSPAQPAETSLASSPKAAVAQPKVNFSAILSAPAPPKKVVEAPVTAAPVAEDKSTNGDAEHQHQPEETAAPDEGKPQPNGHAAPTVNGAPSKPATNGASTSKSSKGSGSAKTTKTWAAKPAPAPAASKEPVLDADDFQLVKGRGHNKRTTGGGASGSRSGGSFAGATKAAMAA